MNFLISEYSLCHTKKTPFTDAFQLIIFGCPRSSFLVDNSDKTAQLLSYLQQDKLLFKLFIFIFLNTYLNTFLNTYKIHSTPTVKIKRTKAVVLFIQFIIKAQAIVSILYYCFFVL